MLDTVIGVIIGGLIGLAPSVLTFVDNQRNRENQRLIKKIEIYYETKRNALETFMSALGTISTDKVWNGNDLQSFLAASKRACMFVSEETARRIETVAQFAIDRWSADNPAPKFPLQSDSTVRLLDDLLRDELRECLECLEQPDNKRRTGRRKGK